MTREVIAGFLRHLFQDKLLSPSTVMSYKAGIAKPICLGWELDVTDIIFQELIRGFSNIRPNVPVKPIAWSSERVLEYLSCVEFCTVDNTDMILGKCIFLLALATGCCISELHALRRERKNFN